MMVTEKERLALLAKGRLLFDSCSADNDYACVLGYVDHNLALGGWRTEVIEEFIAWLKHEYENGHKGAAHANAILQQLKKTSTG